MASVIGLKTKIKDVMDLLDNGANPVCVLSTGTYVLSSANRRLGNFIYTRFNNGVAEYTVHIPFSFKNDLEELIRNGDAGMHPHLDPEITDLPA